MTDPIPFVDVWSMTRDIRAEAEHAWLDLLDRGDFVRGEAVSRFEHEWAQFCQSKYAVGVANGTDAIELTLRALGIGAGDEVVVPANTFVGTVEAVLDAGAVPRFADVDPDTLLLSDATISAALTPRVRAVIVVHLFGRMPDMDAILHVANAANLYVIEDAAQAHGARWNGRRAGSFGVAGCFSFYPGKNLGAFGDGGAVVTSDYELATTIRSLGDHGRVDGSRHRHEMIGKNSRLDTIQAAVLLAKLRRLDRWNHSRRSIDAMYREHLDGADVGFLTDIPGSEPVHHLEVVQVADRQAVRQALTLAGISTGIHYPTPCHQLPPYVGYGHAPLPTAEAAATKILSLPMYPHLTRGQVQRVSDVLRCTVPSLAGSHG